MHLFSDQQPNNMCFSYTLDFKQTTIMTYNAMGFAAEKTQVTCILTLPLPLLFQQTTLEL